MTSCVLLRDVPREAFRLSSAVRVELQAEIREESFSNTELQPEAAGRPVATASNFGFFRAEIGSNRLVPDHTVALRSRCTGRAGNRTNAGAALGHDSAIG
ncbi:hypothetical protein [Bradyrhizobium sp. HKCCYLS20291]|uniref:hypothetical protein n=1 Tax=Bradyrhizobium sp. HKCCYLS20291 TaxID=3420766 RepID=UPI003EBE09B5